jgi:hypothetical protein
VQIAALIRVGDEPVNHPAGFVLSRTSGAARAARRAGVLAAGLLGLAAGLAPGAQAVVPTVAVTGDSIVVTGLGFGRTTLTATRPDALTHKPVVIGQYEGYASPLGPFSVNTTVPTPLEPEGDCWQRGALPSALTPDLQPGDTVTVAQQSFGPAVSKSVVVTPEMLEDAAGPIPACSRIAPLARNAVTALPKAVKGEPLALTGVAQPFARSVSVAASDGRTTTVPATATPGGNGAWSATIPSGEIDRLASGDVAVSPVFEVPDVATGAMAHIAGRGGLLSKSGTARGATTPGARPDRSVAMRVRSLHRQARIGIGFARRKGIRTSFIVPKGARVVRVDLQRGNRTLMRRVVPVERGGSRQAVRLRGPLLRRVLRTGRHLIVVRAGLSHSRLGPPVTRAIVVH